MSNDSQMSPEHHLQSLLRSFGHSSQSGEDNCLAGLGLGGGGKLDMEKMVCRAKLAILLAINILGDVNIVSQI